MRNNSLFDDIARILASPMPRREMFKLITGGLAGGAIVSLLEPEGAHAQQPKPIKCGDPCRINNPNDVCMDGTTCRIIPLSGNPPRILCCTEICISGTGISPTKISCCCPSPMGSRTECCRNSNGVLTGECCRVRARVSAIRSGPPAQADATIQNEVEGIDTITVAKAVNCTVANMPMNAGGTKSPVVCTATKIDQTKPAQFVFVVCTPGPNVCCCPVDPIFTVLKLSTGRWVRQTFADVPRAEHFVTVTNGMPGLNRLHIWVNGQHAATLRLRDNETQNVDLAAVMTRQNNTISLVGTGEVPASAAVNIVDTPPAPAPASRALAAMAAAQAVEALMSNPRHNPIWGPLAEQTEENSERHAADVSRQTVQVVFSGALSGAAAANPKVFAVDVNGKPATVQGGHVQGSATGTKLSLQLPQGTLHGGDSVDVYWENLQDARGRPLSGHASLSAR